MIPLERLIASALGELAADDDAEIEGHVLSCSSCAAAYAGLLRLGPALAALVRGGHCYMAVTPLLVERLERERLVTRRYRLAPGEVVPCTVGADDLYSLTTLEADLSDFERVDLLRGDARVPDVPFEPTCVRTLSPADALRRLPTMRLPLRLVAVTADGDRPIAEYTLSHTAFAG
jgi:hypothetical protein